jgi:hypothetical protein
MMDGSWRLILQQTREQKQGADQGRPPVYNGSGGGKGASGEVGTPSQSPRTDSDRIWQAVRDAARGL